MRACSRMPPLLADTGNPIKDEVKDNRGIIRLGFTLTGCYWLAGLLVCDLSSILEPGP